MKTSFIVLFCAALVIVAVFASAALSSGGDTDVNDVTASGMRGVEPETTYGKCWYLAFRTEMREMIFAGRDAKIDVAYLFFGRTREHIPGPEMISPEEARRIASGCVDDRDGDLNLIPAAAEYVGPHAEGSPGEYLVRYSRVIGGVRCISDGITVTVHPVNGSIMHYYKLWAMPEDQVPTDARPSVPESEAGARVKSFMAENGAKGVLVLSSELQWVDMNYPAGLEDPHDIRLAWRVRFIDDYYRSRGVPFPATMWIDAEMGEVLRYAYHLD